MARIVILGAGVMGSAMTIPLASAGHHIDLVGTHLDEASIRSIKGNGHHPRLNITLPDAVRAHDWTAFGDTQPSEADLVILGISSAGVDWAVERLVATMQKPVPVLMITKGLAIDSRSVRDFPTIIADRLRNGLGFDVPVMAVGGPCIAGELAVQRDTMVVVTGDDRALVDQTIALLDAPFYHARASSDVVGVEICAAFKNFFAIGVGWSNGYFERLPGAPNRAQMHNVAAGLFTEALAELRILVERFGGVPASVDGLAGVGDLYVTCLAGRNSRMGRLLGLGMRYSDAKSSHMPDDTVEGAELARAIGPVLEAMWADGQLPSAQMPLARAIIGAVCHDRIMEIDWEKFLW